MATYAAASAYGTWLTAALGFAVASVVRVGKASARTSNNHVATDSASESGSDDWLDEEAWLAGFPTTWGDRARQWR